MNGLYYDGVSGISGDMHLGAMIGLGVPEAELRACLATLGLTDAFELSIEPARRGGLAGTLATVRCTDTVPTPVVHGLGAVNELLEAAALDSGVRRRAQNIFEHLANAEAAVHGIDVDRVHFHEVGAVDALVDVVAAAFALEWLAPDQVFCAPIELGSGRVRCSHGVLPVPAPATALLLAGCPTTRGGVSGEATTPTGAAILRHAVTNWGSPPGVWQSQAIAYGCGQKHFEAPNLLRVTVLESVATSKATAGELPDFGYVQRSDVLLSTTIDDMSAEALGRLQAILWTIPVLDLSMHSVLMKKQRPGHRVEVLVEEQHTARALACLFEHSSTLGVQGRQVERWTLARQPDQVSTRHGTVRVKRAWLPDGRQRYKAEHDDIELLLRSAADPFATEQEINADLNRWFEQLPKRSAAIVPADVDVPTPPRKGAKNGSRNGARSGPAKETPEHE
ncbi:MAG: nickel pincer cofactor biosynthesis protein LarC [Pseudomonadota bacterium]